MTVPASIKTATLWNWLKTPIGAGILAIAAAGVVAIAATRFVTHEVLAENVKEVNATIDKKAADPIAAIAIRDNAQDASIQNLAEITRTLAQQVAMQAEKQRAQEASIMALQVASTNVTDRLALLSSDVAVLKVGQEAAAKTAESTVRIIDRIEAKLDRTIERRTP